MTKLRAKSVLELIAETPHVRLNRLPGIDDAEVWVKCEFYNPGSSVKDRICLAMIEAAEKKGDLKAGSVVIEPTSGNTGIGLALVCAVKGYRLILTMPESMSLERRALLLAFGAELVLTPAAEGMPGAIKKAEELMGRHPEAYMPQQFRNGANPEIHRRTTAQEILMFLGPPNAFVAGVGTGGTITGVGEVLKENNPDTLVVAVEPDASPVLSGGKPGPHKIQGIGAGFVPDVLNTKIYDRVIKVTNDDAIATARDLARKEGLLVGISAGANVFAALQVAKELGKGKKVVTIGCDTGERYLSMGIFGPTS